MDETTYEAGEELRAELAIGDEQAQEGNTTINRYKERG